MDRPSETSGAPGDGRSDDVAFAPRPVGAARAVGQRRTTEVAGTFAVGFAMGSADLVPGFSGGTVAFVAGIYERMVANLRQGARALSLLVRARGRDGIRAVGAIEWPFVLALLAGILTAVISLATTLSRLLDRQPVAMSAVFLGLILGAATVSRRELRAPAPRHAVLAVVVGAATFAGLGATSGAVLDPPLVVLFVSGVVAICATVLPGISGSSLLLVVGTYAAVIGAVEQRDLVAMGVVAAGCLTGLALFSTVLSWMLRRAHDLVLAAMIGLMIGTVRVLWPWPADGGVGDPRLGAPVTADLPVVIACVVLAASAVIAVGAFGRRRGVGVGADGSATPAAGPSDG